MKNKFKGIVTKVIDKKTLSANVDRFIVDKKYLKQIKKSKNFLVNTDGNTFNIGDTVEFEQSRPLSKKKSFQIIKGK